MYLSYLWSWPSFLGTTIFTYKFSRSCLYSALSLSLFCLRLNSIFFDFFFYFSRLRLRDLDDKNLFTWSSREFCFYFCYVLSVIFIFWWGWFFQDLSQWQLFFLFLAFLSITFIFIIFIFNLTRLRWVLLLHCHLLFPLLLKKIAQHGSCSVIQYLFAKVWVMMSSFLEEG